MIDMSVHNGVASEYELPREPRFYENPKPFVTSGFDPINIRDKFEQYKEDIIEEINKNYKDMEKALEVNGTLSLIPLIREYTDEITGIIKHSNLNLGGVSKFLREKKH